MGAESGTQSPPVALHLLEEALRNDPTGFSFFEAVRTLEKLRPDSTPVGRGTDPDAEPVNFSVNPSISFPPAEIASLDFPEHGPARMRVNFMGLTGPLGVLPHHYTLLVAERARAKDRALGEFLDIFHHRLISLFYRAWRKHRFAAAAGDGDGREDRLRAHVLDLVGGGLDAQQDGALPADALAFYSGLLAAQPRGALALEQLLEDAFGVPVEVEQFVGGWYPVETPDQCALGEEERQSGRLGLGAVVGDELWDPQARVRLRIGPLARAEYDRFLPDGDAYARLRDLTRFFSHDQYEFEVQLVLEQDDVPGCVLGADDGEPQPLGWSTWIRSAPFPRDADETILSL